MALEATAAQKRFRKVLDATTPRAKSRVSRCAKWLKELLSNGEMENRDIFKAGQAEGWNRQDIILARKNAGCIVENRSASWYTRLPEASKEAPAAEVKVEHFDAGVAFNKCDDMFSVSIEERKRLGIKDNEQVCWINDPRYWQGVAPGLAPHSWIAKNPGGRVVLDHGNYIPCGDDLIMAVRPIAEVEKMERLRQQECHRVEREVVANSEGMKHQDDFDADDSEMFMQRKENNKRQWRENGLIGPFSPSNGLLPDTYVQNRGLTESEVRREEFSYAMYGQFQEVNLTDQQINELVSGQSPVSGGRDQGQARSGDGRFVSIAPTVRPRNLMSAADRAARGLG